MDPSNQTRFFQHLAKLNNKASPPPSTTITGHYQRTHPTPTRVPSQRVLAQRVTEQSTNTPLEPPPILIQPPRLAKQSIQYCNSVLCPTTGSNLEYRHLIKGHQSSTCSTSFANELGRLEQGVGTWMPSGTNTIHFIRAGV